MFDGDGYKVRVQVGAPPGIMFLRRGSGHTTIRVGCIRLFHTLSHESAPADYVVDRDRVCLKPSSRLIGSVVIVRVSIGSVEDEPRWCMPLAPIPMVR